MSTNEPEVDQDDVELLNAIPDEKYVALVDGMSLDDLVKEYAQLTAIEKRAEARRKKLVGPRLCSEVMIATGDTKYTNALGSVSVQTKWTHTLNSAKLIAAGVEPETIKACTDSSESAPFAVFKRRKA